MGTDDTNGDPSPIHQMTAAMKVGDWRSAARHCRQYIHWNESHFGPNHPSAEVWHQTLAAIIVRYHQNRRWWQWPWV